MHAESIAVGAFDGVAEFDGVLMCAAELADAVAVADAADVDGAAGFFAVRPSEPSSSVTCETVVSCSTAPGTHAARVFACDCMPSAYSMIVVVDAPEASPTCAIANPPWRSTPDAAAAAPLTPLPALSTSTVTDDVGTGWAAASFESDVPMTCSMNAFTSAGRTTTTLPTGVSANPSHGIVLPEMLSAVRFSSCRPSASGSRELSMYSERCTALSRSC